MFHLTELRGPGIGVDLLAGRDLQGAAVLLHTGWDRHFGSAEYGSGAPYLSADGALYLIDAGAVLVGVDSVNIDDIESGGERYTHAAARRRVHVVEHLTNLGALRTGARFTAAPRPSGFGTFRCGRSPNCEGADPARQANPDPAGRRPGQRAVALHRGTASPPPVPLGRGDEGVAGQVR